MKRALLIAPEPQHADDGLMLSRTVATWASLRLEDEGARLTLLLDSEARRERVSAAINPEHHGLALFCHGEPRRLTVSMELPALLDLENLHLTVGRWVYAFACRSALALAYDAIAHGARCYAGYEVSLNAVWDPRRITPPLAERLRPFTTETVSLVAAGQHDSTEIQRLLYAMRERLVADLDDHPEWMDGLEPLERMGVYALMGQLVNSLVVLTAPPLS